MKQADMEGVSSMEESDTYKVLIKRLKVRETTW
jgi:hypothetical protein